MMLTNTITFLEAYETGKHWVEDYQVDRSSGFKIRTGSKTWAPWTFVEIKAMGKIRVMTWGKQNLQLLASNANNVAEEDISKISVSASQSPNLRKTRKNRLPAISMSRSTRRIVGGVRKCVECITENQEVDNGASIPLSQRGVLANGSAHARPSEIQIH